MDREKVTYGLRCMCYGDVECKECLYARNGSGWHDCRSNCANDALALLKEQGELIDELLELGYPHNFQHEAPWVVDYLYSLTEIIKKAFKAKEDR